jgi:uncharacterized protein
MNWNSAEYGAFGYPIAFLVSVLFSGFAVAEGAEPMPADEVVQRVNARNDGECLTRSMKITLSDRRGKTRVQEARTFRRYYGDEKRSTIFYTAPANIQDTAFLTFDYADVSRDDDQWLYLPELRRDRRISSSNRGDYYLGTDFTYEDMKLDTRLSEDDYTWTALPMEEVDGVSCYVLEGTPVDEDTADELGYGKFRVYIDPERWIQYRTELWDVNGNPLKTVTWHDWKEIDGIWMVSKMTCVNHKTEHSTVFEFSDIDVTTVIPDEVFTSAALQRGVNAVSR